MLTYALFENPIGWMLIFLLAGVGIIISVTMDRKWYAGACIGLSIFLILLLSGRPPADARFMTAAEASKTFEQLLDGQINWDKVLPCGDEAVIRFIGKRYVLSSTLTENPNLMYGEDARKRADTCYQRYRRLI